MNAKDDRFKSFTSEKITLKADRFGPAPCATLISRNAQANTDSAVLYLHGFADYFFQVEQADFFNKLGYNFYALDMRRYGRSLQKDEHPYLVDALEDYYEEINLAIDRIRKTATQVIVVAHSTGGLTAPLYGHDHRNDPRVQGWILNSPFFEFHSPWFERNVLMPIVCALSKVTPTFHVPSPRKAMSLYGRSLHRDFKGEWDFDPQLKAVEKPFPVYAAWVNAIRQGHQRLHNGLAIKQPVLAMRSERSGGGAHWSNDYTDTDCVLNVEDMRTYAPRIGDQVTVESFAGGLHDLILSKKAVREKVYQAMHQWLENNQLLPKTHD